MGYCKITGEVVLLHFLMQAYVMLLVVDNLLLDHVGLPQVVIVAVHLVIFGWVEGIILKHFY